MLEILKNIDQFLFFKINTQYTSPLLDMGLVQVRNMFFWSPLYVFVVAFWLINFGKKGIWLLLGLLLTFVMADQLASHLIKPFVARLRPCNTPELAAQIRLLVRCGSGYSFPSAHATNHFAIAFYLIPFFKKFGTLIKPLLFLWAASVAYAQVYVGVHYPIDVFSGALLGIGIGYFMGILLKNITSWDTLS